MLPVPSHDPPNRLAQFFPAAPPPPPPPPSLGDLVLDACNRLKVDCWQLTAAEDGDLLSPPTIDFELHGSLPADPDGVAIIKALLARLRKGGEA